MNDQVGPVRQEAERLVAAVLARLTVARAAAGGEPAYDPQRAQRVARAAGDVAVAVTGLLRELARPAPDGTPAAVGLRETFAGFASGLVEAAGVDLHAAPPPPDPSPWRAGGNDPWRTATREAAAADADPWRAATRAAARAAGRADRGTSSDAAPDRADAERKSPQ